MLLRRHKNRVTLGVQAVIADAAGAVMLVRHGYRPGWHFPGGGVERGETLLTAVTREIEEETGVVLEGPPALFGIYSHFDAFPGDHIALYLVTRWRRPRVPAPNKEIAEHGFFPLDALPEGITPQTRVRLQEVYGGAPLSERW